MFVAAGLTSANYYKRADPISGGLRGINYQSDSIGAPNSTGFGVCELGL